MPVSPAVLLSLTIPVPLAVQQLQGSDSVIFSSHFSHCTLLVCLLSLYRDSDRSSVTILYSWPLLTLCRTPDRSCQVRDATARNKRKNRRSDSPAVSRPQTQMTKNSSKTMPSPQRRATSVQPRRRKPKDVGARHQEELRQRIDQEMAQLNHNVQQAVNAGRQVAQSTIHATGSIMQAAPVQQQPSEYMYKARVLKDWANGDGSHLRVTQGDVVFVFEDDESGCFECMDERGTVGRLPQNLLQFEEQVPRLRPIDLMGPAPT